MALHHQLVLVPKCNLFIKMLSPPQTKSSLSLPSTILCQASTIHVSTNKNTLRPSANFQPSIWDYDYIHSLTTEFGEEAYVEESDGLKEEVRRMISKMGNGTHVDQLELIDVLQKLGVASHFRVEISNILKNDYHNYYNNKNIVKHNNIINRKLCDLYATTLEFRLLRQHGYFVSPEVFNEFQDEKGNFKTEISFDIKGMLSLYEASFYSLEGESIVDGAREFSSTHLKDFLKQNKKNNNNNINNEILRVLVGHALELPLHWRVPRIEARWFIHLYETTNMSPALLKLAKLDFNRLQYTHQQDLRWCQRIGFGEKLSFARDRPVENFFWTVGLAPQPHLAFFRRTMTKVNALITTIDDIYDTHATLQQLQLFTDIVDRWDINAIDILPEYMKICFLALYNFVNEVAFDTLKQTGYNIIPYLKKGWADLCKSYLVEAKWYYNKYIPSLQEYMENARISSSAPLLLVHIYFLTPNSMKKEALECLQRYPKLIFYSATILRLANDLGTSKREKETGDVSKSNKCYMNETGASEANAREYIKSMICNTWKKMNEEVPNSSFSPDYIEIALNLARMAMCMYQHGDGHTVQDPETNNRILSILIQPIPIIPTKKT